MFILFANTTGVLFSLHLHAHKASVIYQSTSDHALVCGIVLFLMFYCIVTIFNQIA